MTPSPTETLTVPNRLFDAGQPEGSLQIPPVEIIQNPKDLHAWKELLRLPNDPLALFYFPEGLDKPNPDTRRSHQGLIARLIGFGLYADASSVRPNVGEWGREAREQLQRLYGTTITFRPGSAEVEKITVSLNGQTLTFLFDGKDLLTYVNTYRDSLKYDPIIPSFLALSLQAMQLTLDTVSQHQKALLVTVGRNPLVEETTYRPKEMMTISKAKKEHTYIFSPIHLNPARPRPSLSAPTFVILNQGNL